MIWGLTTGRIMDSVWIALTSEAVSWVEMKGSFAWRLRTLVAGAVLAVAFSMLGSVTGNNLWLSVVGMFAVGFLATLLKNIGDRASGLALCVYMLFIFSNAYPVTSLPEIEHRLGLVVIGAAWPVILGVATSFLMPAEEPFRRQIALIWRSIAVLVDAVSKNNNHKNGAMVYDEDKAVRLAIDSSYQFFGRMAHQVSEKDNRQYQLALLRKIAGMVAVNVIGMGEEKQLVDIASLDEALRIKAATLFSAMKEAVGRISVFVITLEPEEKLLAVSHINRLKKLTALIREYPWPEDEKQRNAIKRIMQLTDRTVRLLENAILRIDKMGADAPVFRSYSFVKTLFILKPKYFLSDIRMLFALDNFNTRYALRSAVAAALALFVFKWFRIDHGYWLPFSVMIVIQPYFGATFKKAIDRVAGTVLGGLAASLLLQLPAGMHFKEGILFLTFILMVYYIKRKYSVAVFFITLNLVLLFHIEAAYSDRIMVTRALCTVGGALLAVVSGFALFPTWDKKWLPSHLAAALKSNYDYFTATFFAPQRQINWTRYKRSAESKNSNVFDSFNRYMQEPGREKSELYYDMVTSSVRITRNLNNIQLEEDEKRRTTASNPSAEQQNKINECLDSFNKVMGHLSLIDPNHPYKTMDAAQVGVSPFCPNEMQMIFLEKVNIELKAVAQSLKEVT